MTAAWARGTRGTRGTRRVIVAGGAVVLGLVPGAAVAPVQADGGVDAGAPVAALAPVVAPPGAARAAAYATPMTPVRAGDAPELVNLDVSWHDLVAEDAGPDDRPWCTPLDPSRPEAPNNPRRYPIGQCPLFWADFATVPAGRSVVQGLDAVVPGRVYAFRCTVVPDMTGTFFVVT